MNDTIKEMSAASCRYRDACAEAASGPGISLFVYERGHGTALMAAQAGMRAGASAILLVVPKSAQQACLEQLQQENYNTVLVDGHKGSISDTCRQCAAGKAAGPTVFIAAPNQMAEAGHWHEAWRDKRAFGFVAVMDAGSFQNLKSEKGRGLKAVVDRTGSALLLVEKDDAAVQLRPLAESWNLLPAAMLPGAAPAAASACGVAGMET